jgi:hypothetical protein
MTVAAVVDERRLKRRFDPGYLGEIDVAAKLSLVLGFEIKVFDLAGFRLRRPPGSPPGG